MKQEPKPATHGKAIVNSCRLGGTEPQGICRAGQNSVSQGDGVSSVAPACQLCGSVGGGFRNRTMASDYLDARYFSSSLYATGVFQAATPVLELRGSEFLSEFLSR